MTRTKQITGEPLYIYNWFSSTPPPIFMALSLQCIESSNIAFIALPHLIYAQGSVCLVPCFVYMYLHVHAVPILSYPYARLVHMRCTYNCQGVYPCLSWLSHMLIPLFWLPGLWSLLTLMYILLCKPWLDVNGYLLKHAMLCLRFCPMNAIFLYLFHLLWVILPLSSLASSLMDDSCVFMPLPIPCLITCVRYMCICPIQPICIYMGSPSVLTQKYLHSTFVSYMSILVSFKLTHVWLLCPIILYAYCPSLFHTECMHPCSSLFLDIWFCSIPFWSPKSSLLPNNKR